MGGSASSQLDEGRCAYIRGKTEAAVRNFSPFYRRQFAAAFCGHVCSQVQPQQDAPSQLLKTKPPLEPGTVLFEAELTQFADDIKKWKERYVVIKNDFAVESYESKEAFQRGAAPRSRLLPANGRVLTSEAEYNSLSDQHFPDPSAGSERDTAPPAALPTAFPVFLWLPFVRPGCFCCLDAAQQRAFIAVLGDCVRHLNQDYVKQRTFESRAFLEAVQFFQQEKGHYDSWEMNAGDEVQILSGLVMEELLPTLQADILPRMKGKKQDRKRAWLGLLEEASGLVGRQVAEALDALKEECRAQAEPLEGALRADADQILASKSFLSGKIKGTVLPRAEPLLAESVRPFLASLLDELMGPVTCGFGALRGLLEDRVDALGRSARAGDDAQLRERLQQLGRLPLDPLAMEPCYGHADHLRARAAELQGRFRFAHAHLVAQRAQSHMQELMGNAVHTFQELLAPHLQGEAPKTAAALEKVKLRVLKQFDYDSSSIRKRLCQGALVQVTLPTLRRGLAAACKPELQNFEQFIFADHTGVIHVENIYEEILHEMLQAEALKVIQEAASLQRHNLLDDGAALPSESMSSLADLGTPSGSGQASPARDPSALPPDAPESNDVFQGPEDTRPGEGPTPAGPSPPREQDGPGPVPPGEDPGTPVGAGRGMSTGSAELESGAPLGPPEALPASGSLAELRDLLTVTVELPGAPGPLEADGDRDPGVPAEAAGRAAPDPDPSQGPAEAEKPPEREAQGSVQAAPLVPGEPGEAQGGPQGGDGEEKRAGEGRTPRVFECEWVVERAEQLELQGPQEEGRGPGPAWE
ncbi:protein Niban 1 [Sorex fumeus]|uniref:protein Niban 1 n=1 Tax=Sorex fumeus TaxID=62283 RepID=UPI0024AE09ED|nr:protein Niban 1 [Sorex fumeus]